MTATATTQTLDDIMHSLDIKPYNLIQTCSMRENLELHVTMSGNRCISLLGLFAFFFICLKLTSQKLLRLKDLLTLLKSSPLNEVRSIIVYCKFQVRLSPTKFNSIVMGIYLLYTYLQIRVSFH